MSYTIRSTPTKFQVGDMFMECGNNELFVILDFNYEIILTKCDATGKSLGHAEIHTTVEVLLDCIQRGQLMYIPKEQIKKEIKQQCTCEIRELMRNGCKCGGFKAEQQQKKAS